MTMSPILRLQAIIYVKMVLLIVLHSVVGSATHARDLELLRMLVRNRRVLTEYDASGSDRCSLLQERQREQKFRLRAQALSISNCNGIIIPPDTDKSVCENDVAIFSYSIPKNIDMISDYNVFAHLPTNNQENLRHHYTCALSSRSICDTFKPQDVFVVDNDHACYSRNITDVQPDNYQMKIAVDLTCGEIENCPTLWLDGLPLLHIAHRRYPRCNIC